MVRRLSAFAVAVLLLALPVAATMCQAICAPDDAMTAGHAHHHHCPASASVGGAIWTALPGCEHVSEEVLGVQPSSQVSIVPALPAAPHVSSPSPVAANRFTRLNAVEDRPPGSRALIAQLRV